MTTVDYYILATVLVLSSQLIVSIQGADTCIFLLILHTLRVGVGRIDFFICIDVRTVGCYFSIERSY